MSAVSKLAAEARGRAGGPHGSHLSRHLALFYPDETLGRGALASNPRPFPIPIRVRGVPPSPHAARHGVERVNALRHAASYLRRVGPCLDANGRVMSDRKRSALPVNFARDCHRVDHEIGWTLS